MSAVYEKEAFAERETNWVLISAANTDTQVARIPWPAPYYGVVYLKKIYISSGNGAAAVLVLWDKDLSNVTPTVRGSVANPIYRFNVPANTDVKISELDLPAQKFQAGIAAQSTQTNIHVSVEYAKVGG